MGKPEDYLTDLVNSKLAESAEREIDRLRSRVAELEAERDRLRSDVLALTAWQHAHEVQLAAVVTARDDAQAEAAKWELAARSLAHDFSLSEAWEKYSVHMPTAAELLDRALSATKEQEEER